MIKTLTAITREIDDPKLAVKEILEGLDLPSNLLKNSLGIISCFSEFADTGVLKAICDALPFDCIGATTCILSSTGEVDQLVFSITVLTSDDCDFKSLILPIEENYQRTIKDDLASFLQKNAEKPKMFFSMFPLINEISGDMMLDALEEVTGDIPLFGTAAVDHKVDYSSSATIYNGQCYRRAIVLGGVYGNANIDFEVASFDENSIRRQKAVITESIGNLLVGVNGKSVLSYLEEIGLTKDEVASGLGILPLVVDHQDGTKPVARAVFGLTPEGYAVCGGEMPLNALLGIGRIDAKEVLKTTENKVKSLVDEKSTILSYSCMARFLVLGADNTAEAAKVRDLAGERPYLFACSGGEICPLKDGHGKYKNFYHNYTIVICRIS